MVTALPAYVPDRGDIVWLNFNPTRGHEQRGKRPALVLSPKSYNRASGLALVCPITSQIKGYPFEVSILLQSKESVILSDQVRSVDWKERNAEKIQKANRSVLDETQAYIRKLI
ncbi:MAG: mazF [Parcubacteria group bacterium]|nr:mazF [Parcubacteria group bacterium]